MIDNPYWNKYDRFSRCYRKQDVMRSRPTAPHIIFQDGEWRIYINWYKSLWSTAACISAPTIEKLREKILKAHDGYKFGAHNVRERQEKRTHAPYRHGQMSDQG